MPAIGRPLGGAGPYVVFHVLMAVYPGPSRLRSFDLEIPEFDRSNRRFVYTFPMLKETTLLSDCFVGRFNVKLSIGECKILRPKPQQ